MTGLAPMPVQQIGLFEGYGGLSRAVGDVLGANLVAYAEVEPAACRVLAHHHPDVPNLGDVTAIDWAAVADDLGLTGGAPDAFLVVSGGFPCQDVSSAGRRLGLKPGTRSGLWAWFAYAVAQLRPDLVVIENVRGLLSADAACDLEPCPWCVGDDEGRPLRALGAVLGDLADLGYDARWVGLRAADVGAPHGRFRVFVVAWPTADADGVGPVRGGAARRRRRRPTDDDLALADAQGAGREGAQPEPAWRGPERGRCAAADTSRLGRDEGRPESGGLVGRPDAALSGDAPAVAWGDYEPAVRRWGLILGRSAPAPTQTGRRGGEQLSPRFVEWLMGLPEGHVTGVPGLSRNEQLKMLGNGVVPQQASAALRFLLTSGVTQERAA